MSKFCPLMNEKVTYQVCLECDTKDRSRCARQTTEEFFKDSETVTRNSMTPKHVSMDTNQCNQS